MGKHRQVAVRPDVIDLDDPASAPRANQETVATFVPARRRSVDPRRRFSRQDRGGSDWSLGDDRSSAANSWKKSKACRSTVRVTPDFEDDDTVKDGQVTKRRRMSKKDNQKAEKVWQSPIAQSKMQKLTTLVDQHFCCSLRLTDHPVVVALLHSNLIWESRIKAIESKFGAGTASFFEFVKDVLNINIALFILELCFVVFPGWLHYTRLPVNDGNITGDETKSSESFSGLNILDGRGVVGESPLFFGGYTKWAGDAYRTDVAYILVLVLLSVGLIFIMLRNVFKHRSRNASTITSSDIKMPFCVYVLTSFDYSINNPGAVGTTRKGIARAIQESLQIKYENEDGIAKASRSQRIRRALGWVLWLCLMVLIFYGVVQLIVASNNGDIEAGFFTEFVVAVTLAFINAVMPFVFKAMIAFEDYNGRDEEIRVEISRTFLLRMLTILALLQGYALETKLLDTQEPPYVEGYVVVQEKCAGTRIGQAFYTVTVVDIIFTLITEIAFYFAAKVATGELLEMDIAQSVIMLCYRQGLIFIGMAFCPLIPFLGMFASFSSFYMYYMLVFYTCRPPKKTLKSSATSSMFAMCMALTLIFLSIPLAYFLRRYAPNCGAFGGYPNMLAGLSRWTESDNNYWARVIVELFVEPLILYGAIVALLIMVTYQKALYRDAREQAEGLHYDLVEAQRQYIEKVARPSAFPLSVSQL